MKVHVTVNFLRGEEVFERETDDLQSLLDALKQEYPKMTSVMLIIVN